MEIIFNMCSHQSGVCRDNILAIKGEKSDWNNIKNEDEWFFDMQSFIGCGAFENKEKFLKGAIKKMVSEYNI
jgi:hypothetical protein